MNLISPLNKSKKGIENIFLKSNIKRYIQEIQTLIIQTHCTNLKMSKYRLDKHHCVIIPRVVHKI